MDRPPSARRQPPRAAYIHVPFCKHHCGYCNFTVLAGRDDLTDTYLDALQRELRSLGEPRVVETLFVGGGTPTRLQPPQLLRLLELMRQWLPLTGDGEWTVEANPEDVTAEKLDLLAERGVTRISLGLQSLSPTKLEQLERQHSPDTARHAVKLALQRLASVSVDLIFAAPGETLPRWQRDLEQAVALDAHHISTYGLTIEKGTTFYNRWRKGQLPTAPEELEASMYTSAIDHLESAGYAHYEVSNFARPGHACRHNETYWLGGSYFAFGAGASRYIDGRRETNHRSTTTYIHRMLNGQSPVSESESITAEQHARDVLVFGLRRRAGLSRYWFRENTGFELDELAGEALARYLGLGLLEDTGERIRLTEKGLLISDSMWPDLL